MHLQGGLFLRRLLPTLVVAAAAVGVLFIASRFLWTGTFHTYALDQSLNDQTGYVTTARNLAGSCRYESSIYYPAKLLYYKGHNLPYMPGNYYIRAAFFKVFGYSVFTAILPNLIAFVLSAVLLYHIARELFDARSAWAAAAFFLAYPPFALYAFTAMMELVFICTCLLAVYVFIRSPHRLRHITGALLIVPPFLVRETAVFLVPGFAIWLYHMSDKDKFRRVAIFCGIALLMLLAVGQLPQVAHRPPTLYARLFNSSALHYFDAYALQNIHVDLMGTILLIWQHFLDNVRIFFRLFFSGRWPGGFGYFVGTLVMFSCIVMLFSAMPRYKGFLLSLLLVSVSLLAAVLSLYDYFSYTGLRLFLFLVPLYFCVFAAYLMSLKIVSEPAGAAAALLISCAMAGYFFYNSLVRYGEDFAAADRHARDCASFLDSLGVAGTQFFIAPYEIALDYAITNYPIRWSFVPSNEASLNLITDRFPVGVVIVAANHPLVHESGSGEIRQALAGGRFALAEKRTFGRASLLIYRHQMPSAPSSVPQ